MNILSQRTALLAGVALAVVAAPAAFAAPAVPATAPAAEADQNVADIVVTAQKRPERLQEVPASISVVTATDLTKQGAVRFADYASQVPGLTFTSGRNGITQVVLRGISTGANQPGSTTGFYVDEAPIGSVNAYTGGNGITPDLDPATLGQIEVLKGPQGTLYGAGAVGGLLKFNTLSPSFNDIKGGASFGVNSVESGGFGWAGRGSVSVPIIKDVLAIQASGFYRHDAGYIDQVNSRIAHADANGANVKGGRVALAAKLGPGVRLDLSALLQDTTSNGSNIVDVDAVTLKPLYGDLTQRRYTPEVDHIRLRVYNATLHADLGRVNLVSSTTDQRIYYGDIGDATLTYAPIVRAVGPLFGYAAPADLGMRLNTFKHTARWSEELRATSNGLFDGLLDLQAGVYWTREKDQNQITGVDDFSTTTGAPIAGLPSFVVAKIDSTYEEVSGFANARVHFGSKFDILGGIRYSHEKQTFLQDYRGQLIQIVTGFARSQLLAPGTEKHSVATWLVSPRYRISDDLMVYARAASGYRPGGPNPAPPSNVAVVPSTFAPDKLTQYEVGFKATALDRALTFDAALFYTDWNDIQIQTSAGGFNFLVNGGKARSKGGEASLRYQPVRGLVLGANVNYTDAKLASDAPAAKGVKGDRIQYVPHWAGSLTADYSVPLDSVVKWTMGGSVNYVGSRLSDFSGNFPKALPHYTTVDLRTGLDFGRFTISAFARNLTDKRAIIVAGTETTANNNTAGSPYGAAFLQPRTIGVEAAIRF
jgi:iron complex outermembrane receptor protein